MKMIQTWQIAVPYRSVFWKLAPLKASVRRGWVFSLVWSRAQPVVE